MDFSKTIDLLVRMDQLIHLKATGSPDEFACKLGISVRTLYNYLEILEHFNASLFFNKIVNSYEYQNDKRLKIGYF